MEEMRIDPNAQTFSRLIQYHRRKNETEEVNRQLTRMKELGIEPDRSLRDFLPGAFRSGTNGHHLPGDSSFVSSFLAAGESNAQMPSLLVEDAELDYETSPEEWIE
jgi:hypothetical protein